MRAHMDVPVDTSKLSEKELQFHYFKMHDSDNNNKLDGCELVKSLIHWHGKYSSFYCVKLEFQSMQSFLCIINAVNYNIDVLSRT